MGWFVWTDEPIFETANDIPTAYYKDKKCIDAVVIKVIDGDTYRVRHVNNRHKNPEFSGKLSDHTISVRLAAVDCPETSKMGKPGQEYSKEATDFVSGKILNKKVKVNLQAKDRYGRALAFVEYGTALAFVDDLSEQLLKNGLAVVYRQGGAQYGPGKIDKWNKLEEQAIDKKKCIWKNGKVAADLPSNYKKKTKADFAVI